MICAPGLTSAMSAQHPLDGGRAGAVHLVDDDDVGHPQVGLARVVVQLVPRAQRVDDHDEQVGAEEGKVVVPAVPEDHVGLLLGAREDRPVVDAGVDHHAQLDRRLVLLALLDRRVRGVDVGQAREPLHAHRLQVAVGHRVADERDTEAGLDGGCSRSGGSSGSCPHPVRTAQTATTGFVDSIIVARGPSSRKSAPAARTVDALCITSSCERSEYASTTSSTS